MDITTNLKYQEWKSVFTMIQKRLTKEEMEKLKENEKMVINIRKKSQKHGVSLALKKGTGKGKKPLREHRKVKKKRSSIR